MALTLVTGGTGHLGRDIVDRLVRDGRRVRVFARSPGLRTDVEWATGDLATGAGLRHALHDVDTVINAATYSPIARRGGVRPIDFFRSPSAVDVEGTERLLSLCREADARHFLHVSSGSSRQPCPTHGSSSPANSWCVPRLCPGPSFARCRSITCSTNCSRASLGSRYGRCRPRCSILSIHRTSPITS